MALIILGIIAVVAVLIVVLAIVLMLLLSSEDNKVKTRLTYTMITDVDDIAILPTKCILQERLRALGIEGYEVYAEENRIVVEIPEVDDLDRVLNVLGSYGHLQFRQVLEIIDENNTAYDITSPTVVDPALPDSYLALEDQPIVLEKKVDGKVYKFRLGPTLLTGSIIEEACADQIWNTDGWGVELTLIDSASNRFAAMTKELSAQIQPLNLIAIVLDYNIESYPTVQEEITGGRVQITGDFSRQEAEDLALILRIGVLPLLFTKAPLVEEIK